MFEQEKIEDWKKRTEYFKINIVINIYIVI